VDTDNGFDVPPKYTVSDYIADFISAQKISGVFNLSGGMTAFMVDALFRRGDKEIINPKSEQAAGFAAEGSTRVSGLPAVAFATSGPGATNLITAIASCFFDSTPVVFITGQVNSNELRKNLLQRQNGFQELDVVEMVQGITKSAIQVKDASEVAPLLNEVWRIASAGRPGPVLLDIPIDIQQKPHEAFSATEKAISSTKKEQSDYSLVVEAIKNAKRPLILAGGGIQLDKSVELFRKFIKAWKIPVVTSLMGLDALESDSEFNLGLIGSYGHEYSNNALFTCDLLIAIGSRIDVRQAPWDPIDFCKNKMIIRVDIDPHELSGRINSNLQYQETVREFLTGLANHVIPNNGLIFRDESKSLVGASIPKNGELSLEGNIDPGEFLKKISEICQSANGYIVDVGQHQMWAAQSLHVFPHQRFMTSGGLGSMGFATPAAIGAATAKPGRWIVVAGDGGFQMSTNELETIRELNLNVTVLVLNNKQHGMVAQFQRENLGSRFVSTREGYSAPDFQKVAEAYGVRSYKINSKADFTKMPNEFLLGPGPTLVEVLISQEEEALPKFNRKSYPLS
jgi:acetolactate synthase-1/2/3 large subunit